jgi:hypothetical protein
MAVLFATTAAKTKALFTAQNPEAAAKKAEGEVRAKGELIDTAKLKKDFEMAKFKVPAPLFDTTQTVAEIERDQAKIAESTQKTAAAAREKYATPAPPPPGAAFIPKIEEKPIGSIVSSMAKIGGDVGGPQNAGVDLARQQLIAQQKTADNTAKMLDKIGRLQPATSSSMGIVYQ